MPLTIVVISRRISKVDLADVASGKYTAGHKCKMCQEPVAFGHLGRDALASLPECVAIICEECLSFGRVQ